MIKEINPLTICTVEFTVLFFNWTRKELRNLIKTMAILK